MIARRIQMRHRKLSESPCTSESWPPVEALLAVESATAGSTHGQGDIDAIHDAQDGIADLCLIETIACKNQCAREDVVREHLPVIFAPLFNVHHDNLL